VRICIYIYRCTIRVLGRNNNPCISGGRRFRTTRRQRRSSNNITRVPPKGFPATSPAFFPPLFCVFLFSPPNFDPRARDVFPSNRRSFGETTCAARHEPNRGQHGRDATTNIIATVARPERRGRVRYETRDPYYHRRRRDAARTEGLKFVYREKMSRSR